MLKVIERGRMHQRFIEKCRRTHRIFAIAYGNIGLPGQGARLRFRGQVTFRQVRCVERIGTLPVPQPGQALCHPLAGIRGQQPVAGTQACLQGTVGRRIPFLEEISVIVRIGQCQEDMGNQFSIALCVSLFQRTRKRDDCIVKASVRVLRHPLLIQRPGRGVAVARESQQKQAQPSDQESKTFHRTSSSKVLLYTGRPSSVTPSSTKRQGDAWSEV